MEDRAEIRRLYRSEKLSQAAIAERLSLSRNTVARAVHFETPSQYVRTSSTTSAWAQIVLAVRVLLAQFPTMPATVLAERVGWTGGHSWFAENVARIRPDPRRRARRGRSGDGRTAAGAADDRHEELRRGSVATNTSAAAATPPRCTRRSSDG